MIEIRKRDSDRSFRREINFIGFSILYSEKKNRLIVQNIKLKKKVLKN